MIYEIFLPEKAYRKYRFQEWIIVQKGTLLWNSKNLKITNKFLILELEFFMEDSFISLNLIDKLLKRSRGPKSKLKIMEWRKNNIQRPSSNPRKNIDKNKSKNPNQMEKKQIKKTTIFLAAYLNEISYDGVHDLMIWSTFCEFDDLT